LFKAGWELNLKQKKRKGGGALYHMTQIFEWGVKEKKYRGFVCAQLKKMEHAKNTGW